MQRQAALGQLGMASSSPFLTNTMTMGAAAMLEAPALEAPALVRSPSAMSAVSHVSHVSGTSNLTNLFDAHPEIFSGLPPSLSRSVAGDSFNLEEVLTSVMPGSQQQHMQQQGQQGQQGTTQGGAWGGAGGVVHHHWDTEEEDDEHISASQPKITTVD